MKWKNRISGMEHARCTVAYIQFSEYIKCISSITLSFTFNLMIENGNVLLVLHVYIYHIGVCVCMMHVQLCFYFLSLTTLIYTVVIFKLGVEFEVAGWTPQWHPIICFGRMSDICTSKQGYHQAIIWTKGIILYSWNSTTIVPNLRHLKKSCVIVIVSTIPVGGILCNDIWCTNKIKFEEMVPPFPVFGLGGVFTSRIYMNVWT